MEALNPQNAEEYLTAEGGPKPFTTRRAIITVKDAAPITLMLRWSQNGPILPGSHFNLADVTPRGHVAALEWTALDTQDASISAAVNLMQAHSMEEAVSAGERFVAPVMNLTLADQTGIGMATVGVCPPAMPRMKPRGGGCPHPAPIRRTSGRKIPPRAACPMPTTRASCAPKAGSSEYQQ